ncbi:hypothetical protein CLV62_12848 [Dysgonomonas alginatilytica]|uniref:Oligosaccharide repeat unit polymerase n=1 Tax=Dysgonomonas alginatilytica TaxID=1605892 RepID=A0A2V3PLJ9_9BACT|nr:hypothetical protein [Dysgonomonas alginatilytica]PXV60960.1 hypothetical protein CLV62_12848 [Dysgonomonas alginatilytica]
MKRILLITILFVFLFYTLYPQALSFFGYSFLFTSGALGLAWYFYNGRPFPEVVNIFLSYIPFVFACFLTSYLTPYKDPYMMDYTKSQIAWIFGSYFIVTLFFIVHPRGSFTLFLYYIVAAIFVQCVISIAMHKNEVIRDFFNSLQMIDVVALAKRQETEGARLLGYGVAFFGAGISCGFALIILVYIILRTKLDLFALILLGGVYCFILYVGLLSARTTSIGLFASIILAVILIFIGDEKNTQRKQFYRFLAIGALFGFIGQALAYIYFPEFADWAFEAFINFSKTGKFRTASSDGLGEMFQTPHTFDQWLYGWGVMSFWGSDVGYTRLLFYVGLPGTIAYFFYQFMLIKMSFTNDKAFVFTLLVMYAYNLALNYKGLSDLNLFMYLFVFYFLHYRYYIYTPQLYRLGKYNPITLRNAVQGSTSRRRI